MHTAVSARSMHGAFLPNPGYGSLEIRSENLNMNPAVGFLLEALARAEKSSSRRGVVHFSQPIRASAGVQTELIQISPEDVAKEEEQQNQYRQGIQQLDSSSVGLWCKPIVKRKTKIVCTIGPSTNTREMIWKLAEAGMNVARLMETTHLIRRSLIWSRNIMPKQKTMLLPSCLTPRS